MGLPGALSWLHPLGRRGPLRPLPPWPSASGSYRAAWVWSDRPASALPSQVALGQSLCRSMGCWLQEDVAPAQAAVLLVAQGGKGVVFLGGGSALGGNLPFSQQTPLWILTSSVMSGLLCAWCSEGSRGP